MGTWIGFLRAINLGPRRKFPMADVRRVLTTAGFTDVETHINTGNVRLNTSMRSRERIAATMEAAFAADRGFEVPVVLLRPAELVAIRDEAERLAEAEDARAHYVYLVASPPTHPDLEQRSTTGESVRVGERAVHLLLAQGFHEAALSIGDVERAYGTATARNLTVVRALADKWGRSR